ncbi:MAG: methyltransferase domain-containing protein [Parcubacteria group bacterium]|jgi:SAM-dependent methyltransferase
MIKNKRKKLLQFLNNPKIQSILYSYFLNYHQWSILNFVKSNAKKIKSEEKIIDIGAGELRYKRYFDHCEYTSQDLCVGDGEWYFDDIDIKSSVYDIPVENNYFDYILCTQVLEHLEFPEKAFEEFSRILKRGGKMFLTVPLGQGEHQSPHDFYRYTKYALKSLGNRHGLELKVVMPQGGIFINLEYILWQSKNSILPFNNFAPVRYAYFLIAIPFKILSGIIFVTLDLFDREKVYTLNYNCIYEKMV